ncbi:MAG: response regulator [Acidobacteriota bacterium]|jgi:PAS domain S-box-containing protein|nr:response regulator [Acidobacteriota bacterium]
MTTALEHPVGHAPLRGTDSARGLRYMDLVFKDTPYAVMLADREGVVEFCSRRMARLLGTPFPEDVLGRHYEEVHRRFGGGELAEGALRIFQTIREKRLPLHEELEIDYPGEGAPRHFIVHAVPLFDGDGAFAGATAHVLASDELVSNMTSRVQAEKLRNDEARVTAILDAAPLVATIRDGDGAMVDCNLEALRLFGLEEKSQFVDHFLEFLPEFQPDGEVTVAKMQRLFRVAAATGKVRYEWDVRTASGEPLPLETTMVRIPHEGAHFYVSYSRDLREEREQRKATQEVNERLLLMLDSLKVGCAIFTPEGGILDCNKRAVELFGYEDKREYLRDFFSLSPEFQPDGERSCDKATEVLRIAFEFGENRFIWEHLSRDRQPLPVETVLRRVRWANQWRIVGYMRDLRELRQAQRRSEELELDSRRAQAAAEAKSNFLASMSHEIRTPMNAILGLADLMRTDNLDEQQRRYFQDIRETSHTLLQILNDILDFSKIEAGRLELLPADYDIRKLYDSICSIMRVAVRNKPVRFASDISGDMPGILFGDEVRVRQILVNLLNNAVKYTPEGEVEFLLERAGGAGGDTLLVTVRDTGVGIRQEDLPKVFEKFERFDSRKNSGVTGTGLGLAITRALVRMMGGEIAVASEYGVGTTFTVRLPLVEGDAARMDSCEELYRVMAAPSTKVLLVDDSPINLTVALGYLRKHGVRADTAVSAAEAIDKIRGRDYDLVFMDHMMPEMDGVEAAKLIRKMDGGRHQGLPIIALSANAVAGMREAFLEAGMNDFISKPIIPRELNDVLATWLPSDKISG